VSQRRQHERQEQIRQIEHRLDTLRRVRLWLGVVQRELELVSVAKEEL